MRSSRSSLLVLVLVAACESGPSTIPVTSLPAGAVPITRFDTQPNAYYSNTGVYAPEEGVVRGVAEWERLHARLVERFSPAPAAPVLNWTDSTLVYVALGERPNGGYGIVLDSATTDGELVTFHVSERSTDGCVTPAVMVTPVDVAQLPRWDGPIQVVRTPKIHVCD